jgi:hypothetical protein
MVCVLALCQDMPDGNYSVLRKTGAMRKSSAWGTWRAALFNYRYHQRLLLMLTATDPSIMAAAGFS